MKNLLFSLFAIGLAGVAAIAATTAMLNAPVRPAYIAPPKSDKPADPNAPATPPTSPAPSGDKPAIPDADKPSPNTPAPAPAPDTAGGAKPAPTVENPAGAKPVATPDGEPEGDKDPYEGIAPEDLPPDLQYDADASVSFPTNI
jgi:translation initiation factor IF-2